MVNGEWNTPVNEWNDYNDYKYITHCKGSGQYLLRLMIALITYKHQFVKVEKNSVEFFQVKSESLKIMGIRRMFDAWCLYTLNCSNGCLTMDGGFTPESNKIIFKRKIIFKSEKEVIKISIIHQVKSSLVWSPPTHTILYCWRQ